MRLERQEVKILFRMHWEIIDGFQAREKDLTFSKITFCYIESILEWNKNGSRETSLEVQDNGNLYEGYLYIPLRSGIYISSP